VSAFETTCFLWILAPLVACAQTPITLTIDPPVIRRCVNGRGRATLRWGGVGYPGGQVQIRIGGFDGVPMTGLQARSSSAETGDWVEDGMIFAAVDEDGRPIGRVQARVTCSTVPETVLNALGTDSYWPLQIGNRWTYRLNNRSVTSAYVTWRVSRGEERQGVIWWVVAVETDGRQTGEMFFRTDSEGRLYRLMGNQALLWLDPTSNPDSQARLTIQARLPSFTTAELGMFPDALQYRYQRDSLILESGTLVRGVGFVSTTATLQTGSSGGFLEGLELVDVQLAPQLRFEVPDFSLDLGIEDPRLNLTGRAPRNCALPQYCIGCFGADPPGTYRPCTRVRLRLGNWAARAGERASVQLELLDARDQVVFKVSLVPAQRATWEHFQQVPLYTGNRPPVLLPPGSYLIRAALKNEAGETLTTAAAGVVIE